MTHMRKIAKVCPEKTKTRDEPYYRVVMEFLHLPLSHSPPPQLGIHILFQWLPPELWAHEEALEGPRGQWEQKYTQHREL